MSTCFRQWLDELRDVRGTRPLWPVLLGAGLEEEFRRQIESQESYSGEVFKDRDDHELEEGDTEDRLVAQLYRSALEKDGCVHLSDKPIWLLGFQWPTQGGNSEKGRRADLVGMTNDGALVVFEAKRGDGEAPLIAIMEGLDYLSCLFRPANFAKIKSGFKKWLEKSGKGVPDGFDGVAPDRTVRPKLVVLAPQIFFDSQGRSIRGRDWPSLAEIGDSFMESVQLVFAATDWSSLILKKPSVNSTAK